MTEHEKLMQMRVESYNNSIGDLTGYDCEKCKNRGNFMVINDQGFEAIRECECMKIRKLQRLAIRSGLGDVLKEYTFAKYTHNEGWQAHIYQTAKAFIDDQTAHCFFIGGQIGSGKSHICTAIVREFINKGVDVHFCVWNDVVTSLKQNIMEDRQQYTADLDKLQTATVLYIDDFFKTNPSVADIDKAFQIINYRYNQAKANRNKRFVTIISSEKTLGQLIDIDEAIASRIAEMCQRKYYLTIEKDKRKNMRFKGVQ